MCIETEHSLNDFFFFFTDVNLLVCKHAGPSCCTRKMEEHYKVAAVRDTVQNIRSYSFELKFLLSGHAAAFQGMNE